ncbi:hypothetical protein [Aureliella helgolandensis]|nr:hypothetical protein [Aureliella helgolandensis]
MTSEFDSHVGGGDTVAAAGQRYVDGTLYDSLIQHFPVARSWGAVLPYLEVRRRIKKAYAVLLFAENWQAERSKLWKHLSRTDGGYLSWLREMKSIHSYKAIARIGQRIESRVLLDGVASDFCTQFPGEAIATCHDELIVPSKRAGWIVDSIDERFGRLGLKVKTETEAGQSMKA